MVFWIEINFKSSHAIIICAMDVVKHRISCCCRCKKRNQYGNSNDCGNKFVNFSDSDSLSVKDKNVS